MTAYEMLAQWWEKTDAQISTTTHDESQIVALEKRYGISIPDDFREYLKNAPAEESWDAQDSTWWPIDRIKTIPEELDQDVADPIAQNANEHLFFVDFLVWCWAWAINCGEGENRGKVAIIMGGNKDYYVADSFTDFVTKYTTSIQSVCERP